MATQETIAAFASWWNAEFPTTACPPVPTRPEDLPITARMHLQTGRADIYQNLFQQPTAERLPADTLVRLQSGNTDARDITPLRQAGMEADARALEMRLQREQDQRLVDAVAAERKAGEATRQQMAAWNDADFTTRLAMSGGPSPQAIAQARAMWGITGS